MQGILTDDEVHIPRIRALPPHTVRQERARATSCEQRRHRLLGHEAHDAAERDQGRSDELQEKWGRRRVSARTAPCRRGGLSSDTHSEASIVIHAAER